MMKRVFQLVAAVSAWVTMAVSAQESLIDLPSFQKGSVALADRNFSKAARLFRDTWDDLGSAPVDSPEKVIVARRLIRALSENGDHSDLADFYHANPAIQLGPREQLATATALMKEEDFRVASDLFASLPATQRDSYVIRSQAFCLARSGNPAGALKVLEGSGPAVEERNQFLRALLAYRAGNFSRSLEYIEGLLIAAAESTTPYEFEARLLQARAKSRTGKGQSATEDLLALIDKLDEPSRIYRAFEVMKEVSASEDAPELSRQFDQWSKESESPDLKLAAEYYRILLTETPDSQLEEKLEHFAREHSGHPLAREALFALSQMNPERSGYWLGELEQSAAGDFLDDRLATARAATLFLQEDFNEASRDFEEQAKNLSEGEREVPLFNAAIAALYSDDEDAFETIQKRLLTENQSSPIHGDLMFLSGIYFAQKNDPRAYEMLSSFCRDYSNHPSVVEADLARAELNLNQVPPRLQGAREILDRLRQMPLSLTQSERLDYTAVWIEAIDSESNEMDVAASNFLRDWPNSEYRGEVSMLLAGQHYEKKEFAEARKLYLSVAEGLPDSEYAETALFFAAKSAPRTEENLETWDRIIGRGGELAQAARHEKGLLLLALNRFEDAQIVFEEVIHNAKSNSVEQLAALSEIGYAYYREALERNSDSDMLNRAAEIFGRVSRLAKSETAWRYEAAVRRGKCLEALGKPAVALEIYRSIVEETDSLSQVLTPDRPLREMEWVYRAGFAAIDILESQENWSEAIQVADTLSRKNGPRAIEAAAYADHMRLKHWVWE